MDILLKDRDHATDPRGCPKTITGRDEKIQRAMIALSVPKGAFALDPQLGSLLNTLGQTPASQLSERAYGYIQQAIAHIEGVSLVDARCSCPEEGLLEVSLILEAEGEQTAMSFGVQS